MMADEEIENVDQDDKPKGGKKVFMIVLGASLLSFGGGSAAGFYAWQASQPAHSTEHENVGSDDHDTRSETYAHVSDGEHQVGRIVVKIASKSEKDPMKRLLIEPVITFASDAGHADAGGDAGDHGEGEDDTAPVDPISRFNSKFRDVFVEYLSQVSEEEISGSFGMMNLRAELLRRARLVTGDETPTAVLIREFLIQ